MSEQTATAQLQFTMSRAFASGTAALWDAWINPDLLAAWFHPAGVSSPRELITVDARQGGRYEYTLLTPDERTFPSHGEYLEFVPESKLVFTWFEPGNLDAPPAIVIVTFEGSSNGSQLELVVLGRPGAPGDQAFYDAWAQQLEHLGALVG